MKYESLNNQLIRANFEKKYFLGIFRLLAVFFIAKYILQLIRSSAHRGLITLASFIFAGAVGNILDNLFYGLLFDSGTSWNYEIGYWVGY